MQINFDEEKEADVIAALERVRANRGARSGRAAVALLITEADAAAAPKGSALIVQAKAERAADRRAKRKGARS